MNLFAIACTALVPIILGFIWYHPRLFGKIWMREAGLLEEQIRNSNMLKILGLTLLLGFTLAFMMQVLVIHQSHIRSLFYLQPINDPGTEAGALYKKIMDNYGQSYRTFKHGSFHGTILGFLVIVPVIAINALFERKSFKYIAVHAGYWILTFALMGGLISAFA
ncbi:MAG TPA: DUF1761 domain-containing protein [Bacteroidia bacterium]|nr:DUF1761 domain-containing protein [Bacteroidia bacterium]